MIVAGAVGGYFFGRSRSHSWTKQDRPPLPFGGMGSE
jgi:hypothetical protein